MAKVTNPLQSSEASGQIGKAMVHFRWKGLHCVRSYVIPANPNTEGQAEVRGFFTDCVNAWHNAKMVALDKDAWRRWAEVLGRPMTNMNAFISSRMKEVTKGRTWGDTWNISLLLGTVSGITFTIDAPEDHALKCESGTSLTYRPKITNATWNAVDLDWDVSITGLASNTTYYFRCYTDVANKYGYTGVYLKKTASA